MHSQELRLEIMRRRSKIAALMAQGATNQFTIMAQLGMEPTQQRTVARDMVIIRRWWRMRIAKKYDNHVALMVARLDRVLDEAWAAWERSKQPRESSRSRTSRRGQAMESTAAELKKEQRDGNAKFMELIIRTIDKLCELLDLFPAKRVLHGDAETTPAKPGTEAKYDISRLSAADCATLREIRGRLLTTKAN